MIKYDYTVTVTGNTAKLDKDIYLFRGNKNVHYYFAIKNASFNFKGTTDLIEKTNAINAAVTVIKPNNVEVASAIAKVENGKIHLKVTEDLIDEEVEVGDFDLVFDLFDDTDGAVTIPKVIGQFHVLERPCTTPISELVATNTTNEVDQALTDYAIVTYAEPVASTNADGTFAKKTWVAKEKITTAELNRMEEGISDVSSQCKDIASLITQDEKELNFDNLTVSNSVSANVDDTVIKQEYLGGYIEIQPDSWDGSVCAVDSTTKTWGFPMSLLPTEQEKIKNRVFNGEGNIMYIRFPLGFAYRGYRNIDEASGLAKNIGERFKGQNKRLKLWFDKISEVGGGLAPEYWCPPPYWLTSGSYNGSNQISAGGTYDRTTTLASIKTTDETQYKAQINAFTDAIVNDLEYLHQNIAPVRMFGLQNEPQYGQMNYGACKYDAQTYNDVLEILYPKIQASTILSTYNDEENKVKLLVASSDEGNPFSGIASKFISNHSDWIWGYTHHSMRKASGESSGVDTGADWYKSTEFSNIKGSKKNVFINEYEYFSAGFGTNDFKCSNNMLHLINELVYGEAKVLHPIIHICKPLGQSLSSTNTSGYCMFAVNLKGDYGIDITNSKNEYGLNKGTFIPNTWVYNSWAMFGENLPIGAYLVGNYSNTIDNGGWCVYKYRGKLYLFMANNSNANLKISLTFKDKKYFKGKNYSMDYCGTKIGDKKGETIDFIVPAYSGQCWIEKDTTEIDLIHCTNITINNSTLSFTTTDTQTLTATVTPTDTTDTVVWSVSPTGICTVNNGIVTPIKNGTCVITATCGTKTATCNITVSGITTQYTITNNLTNCTNSNPSTTIAENSSYSAVITANIDNELIKVTVTMGGIDITSTSYSNGNINITNVTGNIIITGIANNTSTTLTFEKGGINYTTGLDEDSNFKLRSGFIEVNGTTTLNCSNISIGTNGFVCRTYDKNKTFINSNPSQLTYKEITVSYDNNIKYIRVILASDSSYTQPPSIKTGDTFTINNNIYTIKVV